MTTHKLSSSWPAMDLQPLPYESTVSYLWRFQWRNVLSRTALRSILGMSPGFPLHTFYKDAMTLRVDFGLEEWRSFSEGERYMLQALDKRYAMLLSERFRFCGLCLQDGYHSYWHQFLPLSHCPMHHCPLVDQCQRCGNKTANYNFRELFATPYLCKPCELPVSGTDLSIENHRDFREHSNELQLRFGRCHQWFRVHGKGLQNERHVELKWEAAQYANLSTTCFLSLCLASDVPPFPNHSSVRATHWPIVMVSWKHFMHDVTYNDVSRRQMPRYTLTKCAHRLYRSMLRIIEQWIGQAECRGALKKAFGELTLNKDNSLTCVGYDKRALAYVVFRFIFEKRITSLDYRSSYVEWSDRIDFPSVNNRTCRVSWKALFISCYACVYHRVTRSKDAYINLSHFDFDLVPWHARTKCSEEHIGMVEVEGVTVFPMVQGLPNPLKSVTYFS